VGSSFIGFLVRGGDFRFRAVDVCGMGGGVMRKEKKRRYILPEEVLRKKLGTRHRLDPLVSVIFKATRDGKEGCSPLPETRSHPAGAQPTTSSTERTLLPKRNEKKLPVKGGEKG